MHGFFSISFDCERMILKLNQIWVSDTIDLLQFVWFFCALIEIHPSY